MKKSYHYASVIEALAELKEKGFEYDYNIHRNEIELNPDNFEIIEIYRYEGMSNPDDESTVYGIKSKDGERGVYVAGYAANSSERAAQILLDLSIKDFSR